MPYPHPQTIEKCESCASFSAPLPLAMLNVQNSAPVFPTTCVYHFSHLKWKYEKPQNTDSATHVYTVKSHCYKQDKYHATDQRTLTGPLKREAQ